MKNRKRSWKGWIVITHLDKDIFWKEESAKLYVEGTDWKIIPVTITER